MNLTYLQYQLHCRGITDARIQRRKNCAIHSWRLYEEPLEAAEGVLYVIEGERLMSLRKHQPEVVFFVWNYPLERELPEYNGIYLGEGLSFAAVLEILNQVFRDYERWEFALAYPGEMSLDHLLEYATPILHTPLTIVDNQFQFLARNSLHLKAMPGEQMGAEELDSFLWTDAFKACTRKRGLFHFYVDSVKKDMLCWNIILSNRFYARILASVEEERYQDVLIVLFTRLAACVEDVFQEQKAAPIRSARSKEFHDAVEILLEGKPLADDFILKQNRWAEGDEYQIVVFRCSRYFPLEEGEQYLYRQIQNVFPESCVIERNEDFICVRNLSVEEHLVYDFREKLAVFLREHVAKAGISRRFRGKDGFHIHLKQAYDVLKIGERKAPHFWYYYFEEYAFDYLLSQCTAQYAPWQVVSPALQILKEHDEEKETDLYKTLKLYLDTGGNATKTAEQLFLHRSSLMKRLHKIEGLTGIRLEDRDTCLYLGLSYKILEQASI